MTQAYDCLTFVTSPIHTSVNLSLKRILRLVSDDDVILTFSDGSQLIYKRGQSWRQDRLIIDDSEAGE